MTLQEEAAIRSAYEQLTKLLIQRGWTITSMESCTAGQVISLITDTEGSSAVVKGADVTYSNEAKIMAGVSEHLIEQYGVYSKETAIAMAQTCKAKYGSDIGIGVTGTFGNIDSENADSVPGEVYFAVAMQNEISVYERQLKMQGSRHEYKMAAAKYIVEVLLEKVKI